MTKKVTIEECYACVKDSTTRCEHCRNWLCDDHGLLVSVDGTFRVLCVTCAENANKTK